MDLVVDANILFSVLIYSGKTEEIIFKEDIHLFAPEFLFDEFQKYKELILNKTKRESQEFDKLLTILKKRIKTMPNEETERYLTDAKRISPDPKDADYFALALKLRCAIWSNDSALKKQDVITVYSTEDLLKMRML